MLMRPRWIKDTHDDVSGRMSPSWLQGPGEISGEENRKKPVPVFSEKPDWSVFKKPVQYSLSMTII